MKIDVRDLVGSPGEQREYDLTVQVPPVEVGGRPLRFEPAHLQLTLTSTPKGILASGRLSSSAALECGRCLVEFRQTVSDSFEHLFLLSEPPSSRTPSGARGARAGNLPADDDPSEELGDDEELDVSPITDGQIDFGPIIAAVLDLALPMKPLCRPDCQGLCPICGQPLDSEQPCKCQPENIDPRLATLAKLLPTEDPPAGGEPRDSSGKTGRDSGAARTKERQ